MAHLNRNKLELIFRVASGGLSKSHPFHSVACCTMCADSCAQYVADLLLSIEPVSLRDVRGGVLVHPSGFSCQLALSNAP